MRSLYLMMVQHYTYIPADIHGCLYHRGLMRHVCVNELCCHRLTHWGRVTHICISNLTTVGSDNGLSSSCRHAIIWTNAVILSIGPLGTNFSDCSSYIFIQENASENVIWKMAANLSWPQCVKAMECRLFSAKPSNWSIAIFIISRPIRNSLQWNLNMKYFFKEMHLECHLQNGGHFVQASKCWWNEMLLVFFKPIAVKLLALSYFYLYLLTPWSKSWSIRIHTIQAALWNTS